jgi:hypothetical protein
MELSEGVRSSLEVYGIRVIGDSAHDSTGVVFEKPELIGLQCESPDTVTLLLKNGANVGARTRNGLTAITFAEANRDRIAPYDRSGFNAPYTSIPEAGLLKSAQMKHSRVIELLQNSRTAKRK